MKGEVSWQYPNVLIKSVYTQNSVLSFHILLAYLTQSLKTAVVYSSIKLSEELWYQFLLTIITTNYM